MNRSFVSLLVLGVGVLVVVYWYVRPKDDTLLYKQSLVLFKRESLAQLPVGYSPEGAARLFDQAIQQLESGVYENAELDKLTSNLAAVLKDHRLDSLEIRLLLQNLETFTQVK